jgi:hypothetical protein
LFAGWLARARGRRSRAAARQERFATRPAEKDGPKNYGLVSICFSADSTRLAVAQTDKIVFVYNLGATWCGPARRRGTPGSLTHAQG